MHYRMANIDDLDALASLHAISWRATYRGIFCDDYLENEVWDERKNYWQKRLSAPSNNQYVLIAIENQQICAFICALGNESEKWGTFIENLHVAKSAQGKGIGKQLIYLVANWADELFHHKGIYLEVLEDNLSARHFYQSIGAKHQETSLWLPPGGDKKVKDLLYIWESNLPLLQLKSSLST